MTGSAIPAEDLEEAVAWRHDFHRHPELAYEERRTAATVARLLEGWGFRVRTGIGGTGVVGTLGEGGPRIGFRADMDALPIEEETGAAHASEAKGKMHACGHDGHTATLLLAAKRIARDWSGSGTLHVIFQPAEESEGGGRAMVEDGLFDAAPCDRVFALHNWPGLDQGAVAAMAGPMMAAFSVFDVTVRGAGGHAAMPHLSDPVMSAAARIVTALQEQAARRLDPLDPAVLTVTRIAAGSAYNVTPELATISGTARWFSDAAGDVLENLVEDVAAGIAAAHGCTARVTYRRRYPATVNAAEDAGIVRDAASGLGYPVRDLAPSMASEDFAFLLRERPGAYFWLGAGTPETGGSAPLHSPRFDFNDALLEPGAALWQALAARLLGRGDEGDGGRAG